MAYWLYERRPENGTNIYRQQQGISIFGYRDGLIYHSIKAELPTALEKKRHLFWVRTEAELLRGRGYDPDRHAAVIDITPKRVGEFLVAVIRGIAGVTAETWTPFVMLLDIIGKEGSLEEKMELDFNQLGSDRCCDVLYAQGGWSERKEFRKFVAQPQGIAGALLWAPTFKHFVKCGLEWIDNGNVASETRYE